MFFLRMTNSYLVGSIHVQLLFGHSFGKGEKYCSEVYVCELVSSSKIHISCQEIVWWYMFLGLLRRGHENQPSTAWFPRLWATQNLFFVPPPRFFLKSHGYITNLTQEHAKLTWLTQFDVAGLHPILPESKSSTCYATDVSVSTRKKTAPASAWWRWPHQVSGFLVACGQSIQLRFQPLKRPVQMGGIIMASQPTPPPPQALIRAC